MSTIQNSDEFVIQRSSNSFKQNAVNLMSTIQDTDWMLIQRGSESFKVTGLDVKDQLGGGGGNTPPFLGSVALVQNAPIDANRFTSKSFTVNAVSTGGSTASLELTATVTGALGIKAGSDPIETNNYPGTSSTSVVLNLEGTTNLGSLIEVGDTVTANGTDTPETDTISTVESADVSYLGNWVGATVTTGGIWSGGGDVEKMFNGDSVPYTPGNGGYATITFTPPIPCSTLEIRANTSNQSGKGRLRLNDIDYDGATQAFPTAQGITSNCPTYVNIPNPPSTISTLSIGWGSGAWISCAGITISGTELRQGVPLDVVTGNFKLTLPTDKDIKLFQADDVVQYAVAGALVNNYLESPIFTTPQIPAYSGFPVENGFDGSTTTQALPAAGNWWSWVMPNIPVNSSFKVWFGVNGTEGLNWLKINNATLGALGASTASPFELTKVQWEGLLGAGATFDTLDVGYSAGSSYCYLHCIEIDGQKLVDTTKANPVKVLATDVSAKTITVDGGKWDTSNQSQVWSDPSNFTTSSSFIDAYPTSNVFDGDLNTSLYVQLQNSTINWDASSFGLSGTVRVRPATDTSSSKYTITVNGSAVGTSADFWSDPVTVDSLSSISVTGINADGQLCAIEVNGKLLVDAVNDSEVWSGSLTGATESGPENAFDGDLTTYAQGPNGGTLNFAPTTPIPYTNSVRVHTQYTGNVKLNPGTASEVVADAAGLVQWTTLVTGSSGTISQITGTATNKPTWDAIEVDGKLLINRGSRDLGDTKVSTTSAKQGSGTVSGISDKEVTITPFTDNCFREGQYLTVNKTTNINPKTDKITSYNNGTKVITVDGETDLAQFVGGDSVFMTDNAGTGASTKTGYTLTTTEITSIDSSLALPLAYDTPGADGTALLEIGPGLAVLGVTQIKGIRLEGGADYTSYIFDLQIDGQTVRDNTITPVVSGTQYSSNTTWERFFADPTDIQYVQGINSYSCTFPEIDIVGKSVRFKGAAYDGSVTREMQLLNQNNQWVTILGGPNGTNSTNTELTFAANNPDLKYFKTDDAVVGGVSTTLTQAQYDLIFGGTTASASYAEVANFTVDFDGGTGFSGNTEIYTNLSGVNGTINIYAKDKTTVLYTSAIQVLTGLTDLGINFEDVGRIEWAASYPASMSYFTAGGTYVNPPLGTPVKVVSVDTTNNKMVVDGGSWATANTKGVIGVASYQGNGDSQSIAGLNFSPDLVWIKDRDNGYNHQLYDTIRGVNNALVSNATDEATNYNAFTSFDADGFTVPNATGTNTNGSKMIAWCWDAGDAAPTQNTEGTVTATLKSNPDAGFAIAKYNTGTFSGVMQTFGHGLGKAPDMVITKVIDFNDHWTVYHKSLGPNSFQWYLRLDTNAAAIDTGVESYSANATTFGVKQNRIVGDNDRNVINYLFADVEGVTKTGLYQATGDASQKITIGFKPKFVIVKNVSSAADWIMFDSTRGDNPRLYANEPSAEYTSAGAGDPAMNFLDDGFNVVASPSHPALNTAGENYVYVAFAQAPDANSKQVTLETSGGVGVIANGGVSVANKTIILTESESGNARWIADNKAGTEFRVATATKPVVSTTAHLQFDSQGSVSGYSPNPVPATLMANLSQPTLTFPATFSDTGLSPDAEFADSQAYIQASVELKNAAGSSGIKESNSVVPHTTQRSIGPGEVDNNAEGVGQMIEQVVTHERRVADNYAEEMKNRVSRLKSALDSEGASLPGDGKA